MSRIKALSFLKVLSALKVFIRFKVYSFRFFKFKWRYKKGLKCMSKAVRSVSSRVKFSKKLRILFLKYSKSVLNKQYPNPISRYSRYFSFFSLVDFILSFMFDKEHFFNQRDWRFSHIKFRLAFNSIYLVEEYFRMKRRLKTLSLTDTVRSSKIAAYKKKFFFSSYKLRQCYIYFNFLHFLKKSK